jgi:hypothetical protein
MMEIGALLPPSKEAIMRPQGLGGRNSSNAKPSAAWIPF